MSERNKGYLRWKLYNCWALMPKYQFDSAKCMQSFERLEKYMRD